MCNVFRWWNWNRNAFINIFCINSSNNPLVKSGALIQHSLLLSSWVFTCSSSFSQSSSKGQTPPLPFLTLFPSFGTPKEKATGAPVRNYIWFRKEDRNTGSLPTNHPIETQSTPSLLDLSLHHHINKLLKSSLLFNYISFTSTGKKKFCFLTSREGGGEGLDFSLYISAVLFGECSNGPRWR